MASFAGVFAVVAADVDVAKAHSDPALALGFWTLGATANRRADVVSAWAPRTDPLACARGSDAGATLDIR